MVSPFSVEETEAQSLGGLPRTLDWSPELGVEAPGSGSRAHAPPAPPLPVSM